MIITDMVTKLPRGYGFVEFATEEETERAIAETDGSTTLFEGQVLTVKRAVPKKERIKVNHPRSVHRPGQDRCVARAWMGEGMHVGSDVCED